MSHISLTAFALFSSTFATGLNYSGISMGWILEFLGVVLGSAVVPIILAVNSAHVSSTYMIFAAPVGSICALSSWIGSAEGMFGEVTVATLYENWPMFIGCTVGKSYWTLFFLFSSIAEHSREDPANVECLGLFVPLLIYFAMWPLHRTPYDWELLFLMQPLEPRPGDKVYSHEDTTDIGDDWDPSGLARASRNAKIVSAVMVIIFLIIIPFSLYGSGYVFSRNFFTGWTVVVFVWSFVAAGIIWFLPLWQARETWVGVIRGIFGQGGQAAKVEEKDDAAGSPVEELLTVDKGLNSPDEEKTVESR